MLDSKRMKDSQMLFSQGISQTKLKLNSNRTQRLLTNKQTPLSPLPRSTTQSPQPTMKKILKSLL